MHLMYYLDEKGQRVYTLKARAEPTAAQIDVPAPNALVAPAPSMCAEGGSRWQAD